MAVPIKHLQLEMKRRLEDESVLVEWEGWGGLMLRSN